ncbi:RNA pyrophosphohydrolase [Campylobacter troglodytis]|uniref:RNA pyrophosphohydrolase n=1 Tax=Campylobacter troglodytis TaxID=654363 RepID=UPI001157D680|nr:RNA pyrophosphohydrolase [Campylobacter troglodytis]TQR60596.1 RNA pyrophosphohydrolase [Campylobacter troglodytis]
MEKEKKYRPNVAAIVLSPKYPLECKVLLAKRNDMDNIWQFPQGGIDEGEDAKKALFRELKEEIGTNKVEIIATHPEWINYDFPQTTALKKRYNFDGQSQKYFLVRLKSGAKINIDTKHPEFSSYQFVSMKKLFDLITHFKRPIYVRAIQYFQNQGYL